MNTTIHTAQSHTHAAAMRALIARTWPAYFRHAGPADPNAPSSYFLDTLLDHWPHLQLLVCDPGGDLLATANWAPISIDLAIEPPPSRGWDWALERAVEDLGRTPTCGVALAVTIAPEHQGRGLASVALRAMRDVVTAQRLSCLIAPVRPNHKERAPLVPMEDYIARRRPDGLLEDPWMRVHERLGARVLGACAESMSLGGRPVDWERWCGVPLDVDGAHVVPQMLAPLQVDLRADWATYIEPNVWMLHPL